MLQEFETAIKRVSLPTLLIASFFAEFTANLAFPLNSIICLGALALVLRTVWAKEYFLAAGFVAIAVLFSPFELVIKIFLFIGLACTAVFAALLTAFLTEREDLIAE